MYDRVFTGLFDELRGQLSGMNRYCFDWIQDWCQENGWTDLFVERRDYWAFPPGAVMPMPIPGDVLQQIKAERGSSPTERAWQATAWISAGIAIVLSYLIKSPMPLVMAFAFGAITVAQFEE